MRLPCTILHRLSRTTSTVWHVTPRGRLSSPGHGADLRPDGQAQRAPPVRSDHFPLRHDEPAAAVCHVRGGRGVAGQTELGEEVEHQVQRQRLLPRDWSPTVSRRWTPRGRSGRALPRRHPATVRRGERGANRHADCPESANPARPRRRGCRAGARPGAQPVSRAAEPAGCGGSEGFCDLRIDVRTTRIRPRRATGRSRPRLGPASPVPSSSPRRPRPVPRSRHCPPAAAG